MTNTGRSLRIAVTGATGQVARALVRAAPSRGIVLTARGRPELDITNIDSAIGLLKDAVPDVVVSAAAYTAVDKAEAEVEEAFKANAGAPALLATLCNHLSIPLIHISTDYVFDGAKRTPYLESDAIAPLGVYGASKAAGETAVRSACPQHVILRTAWVYSPDGSNFLKSMLRKVKMGETTRVVSDQAGTPTSADDIASAILDLAPRLIERQGDVPWGTYHLTGTGETTWHGFAVEIFRLAAERRIKTPRLEAITTAEYPTAAQRPVYSVLDNGKIRQAFGVRMPLWTESLSRCFDRLVIGTEGAST